MSGFMKIFRFVLLFSFISINLFGNFLNKKIPKTKEIEKTAYEDLSTRSYENITLDSKKINNTKFSISYPKNSNKIEKIGIFIDGLGTGQDVLKYVPDIKNSILIGYEYVDNLKKIKNSLPINLFSLRKSVCNVPVQILCIVKWIKSQKWYNNQNIHIIGLSFGAFFVPAIYRLAEKNKINLGLGILAYGGAGFYDIFYANLKKYKIFRSFLAYLGYLVFNPVDPEFHLPHLHGNFLLINGTKDQNRPLKSIKKIQELTPEPKTIVNIGTDHILPERADIIQEVLKISLNWLDTTEIKQKASAK